MIVAVDDTSSSILGTASGLLDTGSSIRELSGLLSTLSRVGSEPGFVSLELTVVGSGSELVLKVDSVVLVSVEVGAVVVGVVGVVGEGGVGDVKGVVSGAVVVVV